MRKVFIILLNYNGYKDTLEAVRSLEKINYIDYEIVVVDNKSTDNSYNILKREMKSKHHLIMANKNEGFASGNNIGIKFALENGADYILLINNDTEVEKDFLNILLNSAEMEDNIGISTGLILNYYDKNKIWFDGGKIDWKKFYGLHFNQNKNINDIKLESKEIDFTTGCLMLIKKEVFYKCGLLPEDYFMYYEDVDFCVKVKDCGYKIYYNPQSVIYHKISASSGEEDSPFMIEWTTKNRIKFMKKYKKKVKLHIYIIAKVYFYLTRIIKILQYILQRRKDKVRALLRGLK